MRHESGVTQAPQELHPFDGPRAKLTRAAQQAKHLMAQCEGFQAWQPVEFETVWDGDAHVVYVRGRLPPLYLGLILGEVVHDLRSCLDQVAWALASQHAGEQLDDRKVARLITFPIASTQQAFNLHPAKPHIAPQAWTVMEWFQPFRNEGTPRVNPLAILQDWSNTNKHRVLRPALGQLRADDMAFQSSVRIDLDKDMEMLVPDSTLIDTAKGLFRIRAPEDAFIRFLPPPVYIVFVSLARDPPDPVPPEYVHELVVQTLECVESFGQFFEPTDWTKRVDSWITPDLPQ
jgi:hypothetical protein